MEEKELRELIGSNIAKYRRACGMTQDKLAEKLDITTSYISRVERGVKKLKLSSLVKTADILGVSCDALLKPNVTVTPMERIQHLLANKPYAPLCWKILEMIASNFADLYEDEENPQQE